MVATAMNRSWLVWTCLALLLAQAAVGLAPARADDDAAGAPQLAPGEKRFFTAHVAPLLARYCLECHDGLARRGSLDLSRRQPALQGGDSGAALVPGKPAESLLWRYVESGEMPPEGRPGPSAEEQQRLRDWIAAGAVWPGDAIDPAAHARDTRAVENWLRRLTVDEYIATVRAATGVDIETEARALLPRDVRADGFNNTAYNLGVDLEHVQAYARLAEIVAQRIDIVRLVAEHAPGTPLSRDRLPRIVSELGLWLLRGPLTEHEQKAFAGVATVVLDDGGDPAEALHYVVEAMLQSPRFLYRVENQRTGNAAEAVDGYELASRLSYIVWGAGPDRELLRAAGAGELAEVAAIRSQVARMLEDPRAVEQSTRFVHQWLDLDRLATLRPNGRRYPQWNEHLAADMREETLAFFRYVVWEQRRPLSDLLNAQVTFATPRLARHYGLHPSLAADASAEVAAADADRVTAGLQALYLFDEVSGSTVRDSSGRGAPLDLTIANPDAVAWQPDGLGVHGSTLIATDQPPRRLIDAVKKSKALTIEAWLTPADARQKGPARIVSLSDGTNQRNFTLGQEADKYEVRLRAARTDANGLPATTSTGGAVDPRPRPTHVVYTRDSGGKARLYLDGRQQASRDVTGDLAKWDASFRLVLANESSGDRPWRGTFHLVALYSRALPLAEVQQNFAAGMPRSSGWTRYELASVPARGGLLTQASVLTIGGDEASMVARGLFVLHDLLYSSVGNPPPCADTTPVPTRPGVSQRAVALQRIADQSCGGCHGKFEPLAFGLERLDGIGAYHEVDEHGNRLRDDGEILFPGQAQPVSYASAAALMDLLAGSDRVQRCITRKVLQFALGRPLVESDTAAIDAIHQSALQGGFTYPALITAIATSDLVRHRSTD